MLKDKKKKKKVAARKLIKNLFMKATAALWMFNIFSTLKSHVLTTIWGQEAKCWALKGKQIGFIKFRTLKRLYLQWKSKWTQKQSRPTNN